MKAETKRRPLLPECALVGPDQELQSA